MLLSINHQFSHIFPYVAMLPSLNMEQPYIRYITSGVKTTPHARSVKSIPTPMSVVEAPKQ